MNVPSVLFRFQEFIASLTWGSFLWSLMGFSVGLCACGVVARLIAGKGSALTQAVNAALSIQFTYLTGIGLFALFPMFRTALAAFPFVHSDSYQFIIWELTAAPESVLQAGITRLAILSFIVCLLETYLPRPEKLRKQLFVRVGSSLLALAIYSFLCLLLTAACPQAFSPWGMAVVLGFCAFVLMIGLLHILLGLVLASEGKLIGWLYRFFYTSTTGRQILHTISSSAVFLLSAYLLNRNGIGCFMFSAFDAVPYFFALAFNLLLLHLFSSVL